LGELPGSFRVWGLLAQRGIVNEAATHEPTCRS
jgi:hypothetical protein